jgi:UDP-2-acetamido-3-amino-2,3-dideoxy-glucuronate N-acetyltransferase
MSTVFIHPTAVIDEGARIGSGSKVWHFCHISSRSVLGEHCVVGQNVFVDNDVVIGNGVKIQNNVSVYKGVTLEDDVFLGPSMVFTNVTNPRSFIERKQEFKPTLVRKGASIGANVTIICGCTIGSYALVGAGAVVTRSVADYALVVGNPAKQTGWVSQAGESLYFNEAGRAICTITGTQYVMQNGTVCAIENP